MIQRIPSLDEFIQTSAISEGTGSQYQSFKKGEMVKIINDPETIEKEGGLEKGYGKMLAGKSVKVVKVKSENEYDISLDNGEEVYDVLLDVIADV